ncbi:MAG: class A beta-lactamase-related serine hydrolase [Gemmatimonadota bacterium]|nr:MAG: class A beta-lactamase-related serine hydrolase [Gemmatimonadota bacterium]
MRSMTRFSLIAVALTATIGTSSCLGGAGSGPDPLATLTTPERLAQLDSVVPALMDSGAVTGLAIAIATDSALVWSRGFGLRNAETQARVTTNSVFEAASLSKPVFAYAVLQLVDQGVLDLDTPIADYYEYSAITHDERYWLITPRMVLTHSPGFPNWRPRGGRLTIDREPGTEFSYSGEGFVYLQLAVMNLTGEPLDQLVRRLVFEPLGMTSSSYLWQEQFEEVVAMPHGSDGEVLRKNKPQRGRGNAAASLHTTAPDFARFMMAVMNGTRLNDSTAVAMLAPQIDVDSNLAWGLGIGLQGSEAGSAFWHWGDNTGYKAYTISYPEHRVGVVWFTNSENGQSILEGLLAATVGGEHAAATWLGYEAYDSPKRAVRESLVHTYEEHGIDSAVTQYHQLKTTSPVEAFDEFLLNSLGYRLLRAGRIEDAIVVFELNVSEYPDASNPYDSLGEAYLAAGDTARAIVNYEKSVELNPDNTNGVAVLERIRK